MSIQIPQTSYDLYPAAGYAGQIADLGAFTEKVSGLAQVALDAGLFLVKGTASNQVKLPTATGEVTNNLKGVAVYQSLRMPTGGANRYAIGDSLPVLRKGRIYVPVISVAVTDDMVPYIVHTGGDAGKIRGDNAASNATAAPSGVKVIIGAAAGGLAVVEINLP